MNPSQATFPDVEKFSFGAKHQHRDAKALHRIKECLGRFVRAHAIDQQLHLNAALCRTL